MDTCLLSDLFMTLWSHCEMITILSALITLLHGGKMNDHLPLPDGYRSTAERE